MDRSPLTPERHRRRVLESQTRPLGDFTQKMQPDMRGDLPVPGGHPDPLHDPDTVHPGSALLVWSSVLSTSSRIPYQEGLYADTPSISGSSPVKDRG